MLASMKALLARRLARSHSVVSKNVEYDRETVRRNRNVTCLLYDCDKRPSHVRTFCPRSDPA